MRLLVNTSQLRFGGAVQVALSFIHESRRHEHHQYHVVVGPGIGAVLNPADFPANFSFHERAFGIMGMRKLLRVQREMSVLENRIRPDCVVTTSGPPFWRSRAPHLVGFNRPLFIYPESPYLQQMSVSKRTKLAAQRWLHCRYFRRDADALIVQTDDVNQRVRKLLGTDRVHTITNTHNGWYDEPEKYPPRLPDRVDDTFRFLTLTSYYPHKNLQLIPQVIRAMPENLRSRVEFVLTLTEAQYREHICDAVPPQVTLLGPVPPPECPSLYNECDAMFLPTLAECFSASYPEAMKMKKPILTTDLGFARSICQDAALYFAPCDAASVIDQICALVSHESLRTTLTERGLARLRQFDTAPGRAQKILEICEGLADSSIRAIPGRSPNVGAS